MFEFKKNAMQLARLAAVLLCIWWMLAFGIGEPYEKQDLLGMTQQQVRAKA